MRKLSPILFLVFVSGCLGGGGGGEEPGPPRLDEQGIESLYIVYEDSLHARALYQGVINDNGRREPFASIVRLEEKHIAELEKVFEKYGVRKPSDSWPGKVQRYGSMREACRETLSWEGEHVSRVHEQLYKVENRDLISVFTQVREESRNNVIPYLQMCYASDID